jgi:cell division protein FtsB
MRHIKLQPEVKEKTMDTQITIDYSEYIKLNETVEQLLQENEFMKKRISLLEGQERNIVETLAKLIDDVVWNKDAGIMNRSDK